MTVLKALQSYSISEVKMKFAEIKDNIIVNIAIFDDLKTVEEFETSLNTKYVELESGYGIGDRYIDGEFLKNESISEPQDAETDIISMMVDHEYRLTLLELGVETEA